MQKKLKQDFKCVFWIMVKSVRIDFASAKYDFCRNLAYKGLDFSHCKHEKERCPEVLSPKVLNCSRGFEDFENLNIVGNCRQIRPMRLQLQSWYSFRDSKNLDVVAAIAVASRNLKPAFTKSFHFLPLARRDFTIGEILYKLATRCLITINQN